MTTAGRTNRKHESLLVRLGGTQAMADRQFPSEDGRLTTLGYILRLNQSVKVKISLGANYKSLQPKDQGDS